MDINIKPFFSVAIPTWEIQGLGKQYLEYSFNVLAQQTFKDFEVIVSDHSQNEDIEDLCEQWNSLIKIKYYRNSIGRGKIAPNMNNAIKKSSGSFIKMLFQDDFLFDVDSLQIIFDSIKQNEDRYWFVTSSVHTRDCSTFYDKMTPFYHERIYSGVNTISCPSVLCVKNSQGLPLFDESLNWLVDVEYYKRLKDLYGYPTVIEKVCTVNRESEIRTTNLITENQKKQEVERVTRMYEA
jgi:glycosyltransferase involved in cell wall biosynthesis